MADEKAVARRARLDERQLDKVYKSGNISAVNPDPPPGHYASATPALTKAQARRGRLEENDNERYYRSAPRAAQPAGRQMPRDHAQARGVGGEYAVRLADDVRPVVDAVCAAVAGTDAVATVRVAPNLMARVRAAFDLKVTSEAITEDEYRGVSIRKLAEAGGRQEPAQDDARLRNEIRREPEVEEARPAVDPSLDFLAGGSLADDDFTAPEANVQRHATPPQTEPEHQEVSPPTKEEYVPTEPLSGDGKEPGPDSGDDDIGGEPPVESHDSTTPDEPGAARQQGEQTRRGRRHGRGS